MNPQGQSILIHNLKFKRLPTHDFPVRVECIAQTKNPKNILL